VTRRRIAGETYVTRTKHNAAAAAWVPAAYELCTLAARTLDCFDIS
jgi:hypothetical protein